MTIFNEIKSFIPTSLVDWDGKVSAVIFLGRCNFRCPACYNKQLVLEPEKLQSIKFQEIVRQLEINKQFVDGIVITGGEPTIYSDFPELCQEFVNLGYKVKIDTNGTNPEVLQVLLDRKLVDFVAMDIKTNWVNYPKIAGADADISKIKKSIEIVSKFPEYEFRTTVYPGISAEDLKEIACYLKEHGANKKYFIHQFKPDNCLSPELEKLKPYTNQEIEGLFEAVKDSFVNAAIRNL